MAFRLLAPGSEPDSATLAARIPLVDADDNVLGVLRAIDTKPRRWREDDVATLRRLAERAGLQLVAQTA